MDLHIYNAAEQFVVNSFNNAGKPTQIKHFVQTVHWLKVLTPESDEALLVAAIAHDIERAFRQKDLLEKRESDKKKNIFKSGCDERYGNETDRYDIIFNITQFVYQMNLLQKLESSQVSVTDKISAIKQYKKDTSDDEYVAQLKLGGLYKDWNIDL